MAFTWLLLAFLLSSSNGVEIELLECEPPDLPVWGGYGPQQSYYLPGDVIHYYCDVDTFMGGNFYRRCLDTGDWSGDTPVCDAPSGFKSTTQSSDISEESTSEAAVDGLRSTCAETIGGEKEEWSGTFPQPGQLIRVMLFLPKGPVSYQVVLVKEKGEEFVCATHTTNMERYEWTIHNCAEPHNTGAVGLKIKSLSDEPLKICEIVTHVLTSPKCVDPHYPIENGRLRLNRKTATLVCDRGYTRSPVAKLECVRDGQWTRKTLYCQERQWEMDNSGERGPGRDNDPQKTNPAIERSGM